MGMSWDRDDHDDSADLRLKPTPCQAALGTVYVDQLGLSSITALPALRLKQ